jgi:hypothetical protein
MPPLMEQLYTKKDSGVLTVLAAPLSFCVEVEDGVNYFRITPDVRQQLSCITADVPLWRLYDETCKTCETPIAVSQSTIHYCSNNCRAAGDRKKAREWASRVSINASPDQASFFASASAFCASLIALYSHERPLWRK